MKIKCACGTQFAGWEDKEDTCPNCLKLLLSTKKYQVILADPPWNYGCKHYQDGGRAMKNINEQYPTMSLKQMKSLPISNVCDKNSVCFMWVTDSHLEKGLELLSSWGFKYKTIGFVWLKKTTKGNNCVNFSPWTLKSTEICIMGTKGSIGKLKTCNNVRQLVEAVRTKHSVKPLEVHTRIEELFANTNRLELFARKTKKGWDSFGNEIDKYEQNGRER